MLGSRKIRKVYLLQMHSGSPVVYGTAASRHLMFLGFGHPCIAALVLFSVFSVLSGSPIVGINKCECNNWCPLQLQQLCLVQCNNLYCVQLFLSCYRERKAVRVFGLPVMANTGAIILLLQFLQCRICWPRLSELPGSLSSKQLCSQP